MSIIINIKKKFKISLILSVSCHSRYDKMNTEKTKGGKENDCLSRKAFLQFYELIILSKYTTKNQ